MLGDIAQQNCTIYTPVNSAVSKVLPFRSYQLHQTGFTHKGDDAEWDAVLLRVIIREDSIFARLIEFRFCRRRILAEVG